MKDLYKDQHVFLWASKALLKHLLGGNMFQTGVVEKNETHSISNKCSTTHTPTQKKLAMTTVF
jgi:hypothetical protein